MTFDPGIPPPPGAYGASPYDAPGAVPAPEQAIAQDIPCRKCGYNLRGLTPSMRCPECGTAVGYSLQGDILRYCDPRWVDTLRRGVAMIIWGIAVIVFGVILMIPLAIAQAGDAALMLLAGCMILGYILMMVGWWFATQPDPSGLGEDQYGTSRKIIRFALLIGVAQTLVALLVMILPLDRGLVMLLSVFLAIAAVIGVLGLFAELAYLKKIALRIPDSRLSDRANFLMYALGITYALVQALNLFMEMAGGPRAGGEAIGCFRSIAGICLLVFGIMYLLLLERLRRSFKRSAAEARATWAAAPWSPSMPYPA